MKKHLVKLTVLVLVIVVCAFCFTACAPKDYASAEQKLKDANIPEIMVYTGDALETAFGDYSTGLYMPLGSAENLVAVITAGNTTESNVRIFFYKDINYAKENYKLYKKSMEMSLAVVEMSYVIGEYTEEQYNEVKDAAKDIRIVRSGNVLVVGSGAAYKAVMK